jgi:hypothetical protein
MPYLNCLACNTRLYSTEIKPIRSGIYAPIAARCWSQSATWVKSSDTA